MHVMILLESTAAQTRTQARRLMDASRLSVPEPCVGKVAESRLRCYWIRELVGPRLEHRGGLVVELVGGGLDRRVRVEPGIDVAGTERTRATGRPRNATTTRRCCSARRRASMALSEFLGDRDDRLTLR